MKPCVEVSAPKTSRGILPIGRDSKVVGELTEGPWEKPRFNLRGDRNTAIPATRKHQPVILGE